MSCPDWPNLAARRDQDPEGELLWGRALTHLDGCESCRGAAYAAEPTLVFRRLPTLEATSAEVEAMRRAVDALRQARPMVEPGAFAERHRASAGRASAGRASTAWMRAAALAAVAAGAVLLWSVLGPEATDPVTQGATTEKRGLTGEIFTTAEAGPRDLRFEIRVLRASKHALAGPGLDASDLPPKLVEELNSVIRYEHYQMLAQAGVDSAEGESSSSALGDGFEVSFKTGSVVGGGHILVEDFTIEKKAVLKGPQAAESTPVLRAPLELELDEPFTLFVGNLNDEDLLVVAVTCHSAAR